MIPYHGTPMTPLTAAATFFAARHAMVSFATIDRGGVDQMPVIAEVAQSFALDNGAFTAWRSGAPVTDWRPFYAWVDEWRRHPGFDWALIPDVIDGDEAANDLLVHAWPFCITTGVPVWHLHESIDRLQRLAANWVRVAFGSSGAYAQVGSDAWWRRIEQAMDAICDERGRSSTKIHGLRMLDTDVFTRIPFASADSTNVARNMGLDQKWKGTYAPSSPAIRALVIAERVEAFNSPAVWTRGEKQATLLGSLLFGDC